MLHRRITRSYGRGPDLFVIEGIPEYSCPNCHEHYITGHTLRELDRLKASFRSMPEVRRVPVVSFTLAEGTA